MKCRNCSNDVISGENAVCVSVEGKEDEVITESNLCPRCYVMFAALNSGKMVVGNRTEGSCQITEKFKFGSQIVNVDKRSFFQKIKDWCTGD